MPIIYAYGTLRPGNSEKILVPGQLYDLGWFPGIILGGQGTVVCERVEAKDIDAVDRYEGYFPEDLDSSLYIRRPYKDGFIYEFQRDLSSAKIIESGDWFEYLANRDGLLLSDVRKQTRRF